MGLRHSFIRMGLALSIVGAACTNGVSGTQIDLSSTTTTAASEDAVTTDATAPPGSEPVDPAGAVTRIGEGYEKGSWSDLELVAELESSWIVGIHPNGQVLHLRQTGRTTEGCEQDLDSLSELVMTDLNSGVSRVLIEDNALIHESIELGPAGHFAIKGACDANGWLGGLGTISNDGQVDVIRFSRDDRSYLSGNDRTNFVWSADRETIFVNTLELETATGEPVLVDETDILRVHARLADGSALVSTENDGNQLGFWLLAPGESLADIPDRDPDVVAETTYPTPRIQTSETGELIVFNGDTWDDFSPTTILGSDPMVQVDGSAWFSPTGSHVVVRVDESEWGIIDLSTRQATRIPSPDGEQVRQVFFTGNGQELLLITGPESQQSPVQVWRTTPDLDASPAGLLRLAPEAAVGPLALRFGPGGVFQPTHTTIAQSVDGPVSEAAQVFGYGVAYQRPNVPNKIFLETGDGEKELLVTDDNQSLTLLGVRFDSNDEPLILYQRRVGQTPDDYEESLRSYSMATAEVEEVAITGGWESGTKFGVISGDRAAAVWSAESFYGLTIYDVAAGQVEGFPASQECQDGDTGPGCTQLDGVVIRGTKMYGFGPIARPDGDTEGYAVYSYDINSGDQEIIGSWQYGPEMFYRFENMYLDGSTLVVSLMDAEGQPLPALLFDVDSGSSSTAPTAGFLRPAYLS